MGIHFYKYQGTGNDFVLINNMDRRFNLTEAEVRKLCDRHFGVGADGLMLLEPHETTDFRMVYFNSDGRPSSMCGNGGRCLSLFAYDLGRVKEEGVFTATDGEHSFRIRPDRTVELGMQPVKEMKTLPNGDLFADTGSPHHIRVVNDPETEDLIPLARAIRYGAPYGEAGTNVNLIGRTNKGLRIRTYERGVEDETLSCGTGVTAAALAAHHLGWTAGNSVLVETRGGKLEVSFVPHNGGFTDIKLIGPAVKVFEGNWP